MSDIETLYPCPSRAELRAAVQSMRLPHCAVRPYKGATLVATARAVVTGDENTLRGALLRAELHTGHASDGWKTDYTPRPVWWVSMVVTDWEGNRYWTSCSRYSDETKARAEYDDTVAALRQDGLEVPT